MPGASVSKVARWHGLSVSLLFNWRKQYQEGSLAVVKAGDTAVPASELAAWEEDDGVEILKQAVEWER